MVSLGRRLRATPLVLCTRGSSGNQMNTLFRYVHTHFCTPDPMCRTHRPLDSAMSACCVEKRFFARVFSCKCSQLMKKLSHQQPKLQPKRFPFDIVFHNRKLAVNTRMGGATHGHAPSLTPATCTRTPFRPKEQPAAARQLQPRAGYLFVVRPDRTMPCQRGLPPSRCKDCGGGVKGSQPLTRGWGGGLRPCLTRHLHRTPLPRSFVSSSSLCVFSTPGSNFICAATAHRCRQRRRTC